MREHVQSIKHAEPGLEAAEADRKRARQTPGTRSRDTIDGAANRELARQVLVSTIKRDVEQNLAHDLDVTLLCRRFGVSRASLYRLFEPEGGLAAYVQRRRLIRAFALLTASETRHLRVIDVAVASQFASDATFNRAFRRMFGVTPGKLRGLTARQQCR